MESIQLKHIQNIQNSLSLLKFKIDKMAQLDSKNQQTINTLILSTIPVVDKKLREQQEKQYLEFKKSNTGIRTSTLKKRNLESRIVNEKEVQRSKELIAIMKQHNSMHIKKSKKQNQEKIKKLKELNLNDKKEKMLKVREQELLAQKKIQDFHQQKTKELKMIRSKQNKENQQRIDHLMQQLSFLSSKERQMEERVKCSDQHIVKFRRVIKKVDKMKVEQFDRFRQVVMSPIDNGKRLNSRSISEAILLSTTHNEA